MSRVAWLAARDVAAYCAIRQRCADQDWNHLAERLRANTRATAREAPCLRILFQQKRQLRDLRNCYFRPCYILAVLRRSALSWRFALRLARDQGCCPAAFVATTFLIAISTTSILSERSRNDLSVALHISPRSRSSCNCSKHSLSAARWTSGFAVR